MDSQITDRLVLHQTCSGKMEKGHLRSKLDTGVTRSDWRMGIDQNSYRRHAGFLRELVEVPILLHVRLKQLLRSNRSRTCLFTTHLGRKWSLHLTVTIVNGKR